VSVDENPGYSKSLWDLLSKEEAGYCFLDRNEPVEAIDCLLLYTDTGKDRAVALLVEATSPGDEEYVRKGLGIIQPASWFDGCEEIPVKLV